MNARTFAAALILAVGSTTVWANDTAAKADQAKPQPAAATTDDSNRKICRQEKPMGSLIPTRVCKTAAQWDEERELSRKMMQDMQQRTGSTSGR